MKNLLTIWLILLCAYAGRAQDWQPFVPGMKYFYQIGTSGNTSELEFFHIDSVYPAGTDTVYLNNAQHYKNDTCAKRHTQANPNYMEIIWAPDKVIKTPQYWKFNYRYDSWDTGNSEFYIPVNLRVNDTWTVNTPTYSATCICHSIKDSTFLSVTDSIKRILCTSGTNKDEIILSKQHGLLTFFHPFHSLILRLSGFHQNGIGAGKEPLSLKDAFLPKTGDMLCYRITNTSTPNHIEMMTEYKDSIISVSTLNDFLQVSAYRQIYQLIPSSSSTSQHIVYTINISTFDQEFYSPHYSLYNLNDTTSSGYTSKGVSYEYIADGTLLMDGIIWRKFISNIFSYDPPNCDLHTLWDGSKWLRKSIHLGDIYSSYCSVSGDCYNTELIGLRIGNKTYGHVNLSLKEWNYHTFRLFPNPASEKLYINLHQQFHYSITNLTGKTISEGDAENEIDISILAPGLYFIEINGTYQKFIKQ